MRNDPGMGAGTSCEGDHGDKIPNSGLVPTKAALRHSP
jgi:hypothetical protein